MLVTTDAIVLSLQPHSDKAHVLHAYTRAGGRVNYMVYGLGRKNPRGLYTPLSLIQITADHPSQVGDGGRLPTLKEACPITHNPSSITSDIYKQTICLFIPEILHNVLRHPMVDEPMYDFLVQSIRDLDQTPDPSNFHLQFLVDFAAKLGFAIPEDSPAPLAASSDSCSIRSPRLINYNSNPSTRKARQEALRALCAYFAEHVETWESPKSLDVLMEVFD